ncbi:hypothetical protein [Streptomyces sp. SID13031]|uniref:hypothetical protein n=1 Tax=Streptomyces sp. SID13031 TaxID=2706046 RepID=UPI0013C5AFAF|nr:hypothetical protein [Streptomyces sp. SID13031]NEA37569.1 hypothetical protein [Streptomyces sp. SID13031]
MTYITTDGTPSAREATLHYVSICVQIEVLDRLLVQSTRNIEKTAITSHDFNVSLVESVLEVNDKTWNRRAQLVELRTIAFEALSLKCGGNQSVIDEYVSTVARGDFGIELTNN